MRPNGLRRWLLRGALLVTATTASLSAGEAARATDIIWQNAPAASVVETDASETPSDEEVVHVLESDIIWQ